MKTTLSKLSEMADKFKLRVVERGPGHFQILDGTVLVNYYPNGKKRSAHIDGGGKAQHGVTPEQAFAMALGPLPSGRHRPVARMAAGLDDPSKRTPKDWAALLPNMRYAWSKEEFEERLAREQ